ncbi:MAG: glutamate-1-semialdehyde 2,1-aminomutase [Clostridiales bacterium]|nr:glutamate-1-semialdehyde 2,1-aminomutase [Clostridiales bacterium]
MTRSEELFEEAKKYIPGGVNSPVRAFQSIGSTPRFIRSASGSHMKDEDSIDYIDFIGSWGPMILGHDYEEIRNRVMEAIGNGLSFGATTEIEIKVARLICRMVPSIELVRMVNSGTEAVMSAIRVARGYTGRDKIVKFNGCYHGHSDGLLVKAGSGVMTAGVPDSSGVPAGCTADTLTADYNNLDSVESLFQGNPGEIAAVIVEPVGANMGVVLPEPGFLEGLRRICTENGALLIFDEVITGFRLAGDGAQGYFGVTPDLTTFGKIIGAGMPVGAYGGRREIMEVVAPLGSVYQAGTLSGNPVAMTAGYTQLKLMEDHPEWYTNLNEKGNKFFCSMEEILKRYHQPYIINHIGSLGCLFFTDQPVNDYASAKSSDTRAYADYCNYMLNHGIYLAPAQFEAMFLSTAHTEEDLNCFLEVFEDYFKMKAFK